MKKTKMMMDVKDFMVEPVEVRRKMAEEYRRLAVGKKYTPAERAEFLRMADAWAKTLPK